MDHISLVSKQTLTLSYTEHFQTRMRYNKFYITSFNNLIQCGEKTAFWSGLWKITEKEILAHGLSIK